MYLPCLRLTIFALNIPDLYETLTSMPTLERPLVLTLLDHTFSCNPNHLDAYHSIRMVMVWRSTCKWWFSRTAVEWNVALMWILSRLWWFNGSEPWKFSSCEVCPAQHCVGPGFKPMCVPWRFPQAFCSIIFSDSLNQCCCSYWKVWMALKEKNRASPDK